jgi:Transposase DDE domain
LRGVVYNKEKVPSQLPSSWVLFSLEPTMSRQPNSPIVAKDLQGFKYFSLLTPLLERLHTNGTASDKAGNRRLFFDQYAALLLLYFFNPILTSFNGLQQASALAKVQKITGGPRVSQGSLSEAQGVFEASLLEGLIAELAERVAPVTPPQEWAALKDLVAVDGSLLPACSRLAWALWLDDSHHAAKMHVHFEVLRGIPIQVTVTAGVDSETAQLRQTLTAGRLYVVDRGYAEYQLFQDIIDAGSSFIGRIRDNAVWQRVEERPVSAAARAAGVRSDRVVWLGGDKSGEVFQQKLRVIEVATGKRDSRGREEVLLLATDRLELEAELVALGYRFRWSVELFFRWFKCILGRRHLLARSRNGVTIQVYVAMIASLLLSLWVGKKLTKRTYEMFCLYFGDWATEEELTAHLESLKDQDDNSA